MKSQRKSPPSRRPEPGDAEFEAMLLAVPEAEFTTPSLAAIRQRAAARRAPVVRPIRFRIAAAAAVAAILLLAGMLAFEFATRPPLQPPPRIAANDPIVSHWQFSWETAGPAERLATLQPAVDAVIRESQWNIATFNPIDLED